MTADYQRIIFSGPETGWVGSKARAFNALVDGVDSTSIDDDAYFFYNIEEAEEALKILSNQGIVGDNTEKIPSLVDLTMINYSIPTPTNSFWTFFVASGFVGKKGGAFHVVENFFTAYWFNSREEATEVAEVLRKQGLVTAAEFLGFLGGAGIVNLSITAT